MRVAWNKGKKFGKQSASFIKKRMDAMKVGGFLVEKQCLFCLRPFKVQLYRKKTAKYCSRVCLAAATYPERQEKLNKAASISSLGNKYALGNVSSEKCKQASRERRGDKHPGWIKDRTKLKKRQERNDVSYQEWRKQVHKRDKWKCRIDNNECSGRIEVHHIYGWVSHPELRYKINNGITLCHAHHPRKRAEEKRLIPLFEELVSVLNE